MYGSKYIVLRYIVLMFKSLASGILTIIAYSLDRNEFNSYKILLYFRSTVIIEIIIAALVS